MSQNNRDRDDQEQGQGYRDQNERGPRESRRDSIGSDPLTSETATPQGDNLDDEDDLDDLDELDEDREYDQRESGPNRRFNIG